MRPRKTEWGGSGDLFRARLDQIINMRHELVRLADAIDWGWIDGELADRFSDTGRPGTESRFIVGLLLLKHIEVVAENRTAVLYQSALIRTHEPIAFGLWT